MTTRRDFVKLATAIGLIGASVPLRALNRLNIGVGTFSYHNLSIDDMIIQLNALRIREIEMSRGEFMLLSHPKEELFRATRKKLDDAGIRCVSYYSATIKNDDDIDGAVRFAKLLGSSNITGDATESILKRIDQRLTQGRFDLRTAQSFFSVQICLRESRRCAEGAVGSFEDDGCDCRHWPICILRIRSCGSRSQTGAAPAHGASERCEGEGR